MGAVFKTNDSDSELTKCFTDCNCWTDWNSNHCSGRQVLAIPACSRRLRMGATYNSHLRLPSYSFNRWRNKVQTCRIYNYRSSYRCSFRHSNNIRINNSNKINSRVSNSLCSQDISGLLHFRLPPHQPRTSPPQAKPSLRFSLE